MVVTKLKICRALRFSVPVAAVSLVLAGCVSSPTYGTGTSADEQLMKDVTGIFDIAPQKNAQIDYKPRPEIVKPADLSTLPPPQQSVATASNPNWPETPEQTRLRLRAEATANRNDPNYRPRVTDSRQQDVASVSADPRNPRFANRIDGKTAAPATTPRITSDAVNDRSHNAQVTTPDNAREEFNRRLAEQNQGSPTQRRYLSEPPLDYRVPAATAPTNDIGEDEWKKENRQKAEARKKAGKTSWRDLVPWL